VSDLAAKPSFLPDWAWSYTYPHNVIEEGIPIPGCIGPFCSQLPQGVYPAPLFEALACIALFGVLWAVRKRLKLTGQMFSLYLILNGLERFAIEKIRVNVKMDLFGLHPTQAELIASLLMGAGLLLFIRQSRRATASR
jgi:prolipoprotein diacylglyceryltransferase